jgi:hypothetical protein
LEASFGEFSDVRVEYGHDLVSIPDGERASRAEVILHVDNEECSLAFHYQPLMH